MKRQGLITLAVGVLTATALAACGSGASSASGDKFPKDGKSLTILVPWAPGGPTDTQVRLLAPILEKKIGIDVVVENKPGGGGVIGLTEFAKRPNDGYTIGLFSIPNALQWAFPESTATYKRSDFEPLATLASSYDIISVRKDSAWKTLDDFIAAAKAAPGKITVPVEGLQSTDMLYVKKLETATGIELKKVVYPDGSAQKIQAVLGGQLKVTTSSINAAMTQIKSGEFRALGVMSDKRIETFPDVPTTGELGYPVVGSNPYTVAAPAGTPKTALEALEKAIVEAATTDEFKQKLAAVGIQATPLGMSETGALWTQIEKETKEGLATTN